MDAAAETVRELSRTILPERPHQLAQSQEWKSRYPADDSARRSEEWRDTRLQYMTFLSDADRGVLFTRGYYDIRPEPPKPIPKEINALGRSGTPKKLSLSDYKNKKTAAHTSTPSVESTPIHQSKPADRSSATPNLEPKVALDSRPALDSIKKSDGGRHQGVETKGTPKKDEIVVDMSLPLKPPGKAGLPPRPPSPIGRKRPADIDDGSRPPKRPRPSDIDRASDERNRTPRDDLSRRRAHDTPTSRDYNSSKDSRSLNSSSSLSNGRSMVKAATSSSRTGSPPPRSRATSINGNRPESNPGTLRKNDTKSYLPPLLSPLNIDVDGSRDDRGRSEKKRRDDHVEKPTKSSRDSGPQAPIRQARSPVRLPPPLLSPTLPPEIEAELERRKKASPKHGDDRSREKDASGLAKKALADQAGDAVEGKAKRRLMVTLRIPKSLRPRFRQLMKLSPRKEPKLSDQPPSTMPQPVRAEKRPAGEKSLETTAMKKPRAEVSESLKAPMPPSTPSKKGSTAMSRVSSSNSMTHTPGEAPAATPSIPGSSDRSGHIPSKIGASKDIKALRERSESLSLLGRKLKHKGDVLLRPPRPEPHASTNGSGHYSEKSAKAGCALLLESVSAFMMSFHARDVSNDVIPKSRDPAAWSSLHPLLDKLKTDVKRFDNQRSFGPVYAIALLLQAVSWGQFLKAWSTHSDPRERVTVEQLLRPERERDRIWPLFHDAMERVDSNLRISVHPWTTVEEIIESTLQTLRRWAADEAIDWSPTLNLKESGVRTAVHS